MQRITPNLWFDHCAGEAVAFYTTIFPRAITVDTQFYPEHGLPDFQREFAGKELAITFEIAGYRMIAINAGPEFTVNLSVSLMLNFDPSQDPKAREHLDELWAALADGGTVIMPLGEYPHSKHYGWVQDRFGISWQLILTNPQGEPRPFVIPTMLFGGPVQNRAAEAAAYYMSVFPQSTLDMDVRYDTHTGPALPGSVMFSEIQIFGQWFALMDAAVEQTDTFNCGVSLMIDCADQAEIDRYWAALSSRPEAEACGWCADQFGLSWQVVPHHLGELMSAPGSYQALLDMTKIDIATFERLKR